MRVTPSASPSFLDTSRGSLLLQCLLPRQDVVISTVETAPPKPQTNAVHHEWVAMASVDTCLRARCPRCGVVREVDTRGPHAWVTYSNYGEFLAHGRLGLVAEPECGSNSEEWPEGWDVLGI